MRAIQFTTYGGPEVLTEVDLPEPTPGPGEIAIDVTCAGVNFAEVMFRRGQFDTPVPHVPGLEVTGTVRSLGKGVTGLAVGDRVAALTLSGGGYAEVAVARADLAVVLEGDLAVIEPSLAAVFPCNATTAYGLVRAAARVLPGESVLVSAAAGGVGTAIAQIARTAGATPVYGAVSDLAKVDPTTAAFYDEVFTYDSLPEGLAADVVFDCIGDAFRTRVPDLLAPLGRHVVFGNASQIDQTVELNTFWYTAKSVVGYNIGGMISDRPDMVHEHMLAVAALVADGSVVIPFTELALSEVVKAHELLGSRASTGKFVLRVRG
ncbi:quinone oxidoreductase family protein [Nocardioides sp.]|uniref:quinone oxidoreductase family protein n=1 Tax=Nocardioides sp. TaxID=35761 RepID=UPI002BBB8888|nr:zinc-binding dehydrogenase [Nocardioides sp.]HXH79411.1 zinc-binding dehydrogenase [Nocardioides sp.]